MVWRRLPGQKDSLFTGKATDLTSSHHYGSWQVTTALLQLSSWISAQTVLAAGDTQTPSICVHPLYGNWNFHKCHCRHQCSLACLEICKARCKSCGDWEGAVRGTKCKARTREPRTEFITLCHSCPSECFHVCWASLCEQVHWSPQGKHSWGEKSWPMYVRWISVPRKIINKTAY